MQITFLVRVRTTIQVSQVILIVQTLDLVLMREKVMKKVRMDLAEPFVRRCDRNIFFERATLIIKNLAIGCPMGKLLKNS